MNASIAKAWKIVTGFDGASARGRLVPSIYVASYLMLLAMGRMVADFPVMSVVLMGVRVGMTVAAVSAKGLRYLAFTFLVASMARLQAASSWLSPSLWAATVIVLMGAWILSWIRGRTETRMLYLRGLFLVAGLVTLGMYGVLLAGGGSATLPVAVAYALGILVPIPVTLDVMTGAWPAPRFRTLSALAAFLVLTAANAFIILAPSPTTRIVALALPMGLVICAAARGGLAPASAALLNVTAFASLGLKDFVTMDEAEPLTSTALLCAFAAICFLLGAHVDDLRRARAALEEREAVMRSIFDASPILMGIAECSDDDILHVRANAAMSRCLRLEPGGLDGRWASALGRPADELLFWIDRCREAEELRAPVRFEYEPVTPEWGKRSFSATVCHLGRPGSGRPRFAYFVMDVTDRVRRADERDRFFTVSLDLLCIAGLDGVPRRLNPAFQSVLGWKQRELLAAPLTSFVHPEDVAVTATELETLAEGAPRITVSNRFRCKNGSYRWLLWSGVRVPGEDFIYLAAKDVTAQKETEASLRLAKDEAEAAARAKMQFLANMSHELRTPVNGILGFVDLALATDLHGLARDYLERCRASGDALLSIINDVLDSSKLDAGALELDSVSFELGKLVDDVSRIVEVRAREKSLSLEVVLDPEIPARLIGDPGRLRQVLINLVANAVKFTERGWVRVSARLEGTRGDQALVRVEVADTGIGVPPDKHEAIFQPFAQADGSTTRRYGGTGLGLAIASQLVASMGGRLGLESEPERGSLFHFTLPISIDRAPPSAEPSALESDPSTRVAPLRILLAEDHPVNQLVATRMLESLGHSVVTVSNGTEAVRRYGQGCFDLVLMDVQMPGLDGFDAARSIRSVEKRLKLRLVPIIALTALNAKRDVEQCLAAEMNGYLAKPLQRASLVEAIAEAVHPARARLAPSPSPPASPSDDTEDELAPESSTRPT